MGEIDTIQFSIHLNLLLAKNNLKENELELAVDQVQDARYLLEQLEVLTHQIELNIQNTT